MKFLEIKQGILVNPNSIEAIIKINDPKKPDISCMIYTTNNKYPSELPKEIIMDMINSIDIPKDNEKDTQEKMFNIMRTESSFVG